MPKGKRKKAELKSQSLQLSYQSLHSSIRILLALISSIAGVATVTPEAMALHVAKSASTADEKAISQACAGSHGSRDTEMTTKPSEVTEASPRPTPGGMAGPPTEAVTATTGQQIK